MNALAVEIAAREGARIVWMPTVDSPAETAGRTEPKPGDKVPQWAKLQHELRGLGLGVEPVHVTDGDGQLLPETRDVLRAIARHGLILATAHLGARRHVRGRRRRDRGGRGARSSSRTRSSRARTSRSRTRSRSPGAGCLIERCFTTPHSGKTTWEHVFDGVRAVGAERTLFSSDLGNPDYPAGRGRARALGRSTARERLRRGRGARDDRRAVPSPRGGRMSRRLLVVGAHSADFVWRAGGAVAVTTSGRRHGAGARALLRRAGRVGRALEGARHDRRAREGGPRTGRPSAPLRHSARRSTASTSATTRSSWTGTG